MNSAPRTPLTTARAILVLLALIGMSQSWISGASVAPKATVRRPFAASGGAGVPPPQPADVYTPP